MLDLEELRAAVAQHGPVMRVVIAGHRGSSPREDGASMLVWAGGQSGGQSGTIGGGALEHMAVQEARRMLAQGEVARLSRHALGPELGQCCGGVVQLVSLRWDAALLAEAQTQPVVLREVSAGTAEIPFALRRLLSRARRGELPQAPVLTDGWLAEAQAARAQPLWIWGAGHVGRALVAVLSPLPDYELTWLDTARARFPDEIPAGVTPLWSGRPELLAGHARGAEHLIVTFSHALDLELCHRLLRVDTAGIGLIGSATKWARFRARLAALGHAEDEISRINSPIGDMSLGKHPQAIAIGVAVQLLKRKRESRAGAGNPATRKAESRDDSRNGRALAAGGPDQGLSGRHRQ